jgi:RNA polymerase sigma-70 factor (ECF subfamily)
MHQTLLARCQCGEPQAWRQLYERYARSVYRWSLGFGLDQGRAEEVTQEVFLTATKRIGTCQDEAQLPAWFFQITRRHAANARRLRWVKRVIGWGEPSLDELGSAAAPIEESPMLELSLAVRQALSALPLRLAEVLLLHDLDGRSREEIAEMLALSPGTVASRLRTARALFEKEWA